MSILFIEERSFPSGQSIHHRYIRVGDEATRFVARHWLSYAPYQSNWSMAIEGLRIGWCWWAGVAASPPTGYAISLPGCPSFVRIFNPNLINELDSPAACEVDCLWHSIDIEFSVVNRACISQRYTSRPEGIFYPRVWWRRRVWWGTINNIWHINTFFISRYMDMEDVASPIEGHHLHRTCHNPRKRKVGRFVGFDWANLQQDQQSNKASADLWRWGLGEIGSVGHAIICFPFLSFDDLMFGYKYHYKKESYHKNREYLLSIIIANIFILKICGFLQ